MKKKSLLFCLIVVILCGCSTSLSNFSSVSSSPFINSDNSISAIGSSSQSNSINSSAVSLSSQPSSSSSYRPPFIKEFNEEEYKPFSYNGFVLRYDDANNSYILCDYIPSGGIPNYLELPAFFNQLPITEIAPYAFRRVNMPHELVVSKTVKKIYENSFYIDSIISFSDENPYFFVKDSCLFSKDQSELFMLFERKSTLLIPKTVNVINEIFWKRNGVFNDLRQIDVQEGNECFVSVNGALFDKEKLIYVPYRDYEDLFIPKTIKEIDLNLFSGRDYLKNIYVDENNPYFSSKDGLLYKGKFEELIFKPNSNETRKLTFPVNLKAIRCALSNLEEIVFNDNIEYLGPNTFPNLVSPKPTSYNGCEYIGSENNKYMCLHKNPDAYKETDQLTPNSILVHNDCKFILQQSISLKTENNSNFYADETGIYSLDKKTVYYSYLYNSSVYHNEPRWITFLPETERLGDNYSCVISTNTTFKIGKKFQDLDILFSDFRVARVEFYEGSDYYLVENDMLLNKDKTILYRYLGASNQVVYPEIIIPQEVKKIMPYAFNGTNADKIVLNEGLEEIGDSAFYSMITLDQINFPNSLISIGKLAFFNCPLSTIRLGQAIRFIGFGAFANNYNSIEEIYLSSPNATIERFAFSKYETTMNGHYVVIHLAFDNIPSNTKNWDSCWCCVYGMFDGIAPSFFYSEGSYDSCILSETGYLLDWNYSL